MNAEGNDILELKGLILSGGKGTRLKPMTHTSAKQLLPVANQPIIKYGIDSLRDIGIKSIGIIVSPETGNEVESYISSLPGNFTIIRQDQPLGLAHAIKVARPFLQDSNFIMYLGDNILQDSLKWTFNLKEDTCSRVLLKHVEDPSAFGVAKVSPDRVEKLVEKPSREVLNIIKTSLALVGVYYFTPAIHEAIDLISPSSRGELEITDAIQKLIDLGKKVDYKILPGWWLDTGKRADLLEANRLVLDEHCKVKTGENLKCISSTIQSRVEIGNNVNLSNSVIRGPVKIGDNCIIVSSYVGPYTSIDSDTKIRGSNIENSIVKKNCFISDARQIRDSIVGENTDLRASRGGCISLMVGDDSQIEL